LNAAIVSVSIVFGVAISLTSLQRREFARHKHAQPEAERRPRKSTTNTASTTGQSAP